MLPDLDISSSVQVCPLCGLREASTAHLFSWCPAVGMVWHTVAPLDAPLSLGDALLGQHGMDALLGQLVHQITYRYSVSLGLPPLTPEDASRRILAGLVSAADDSPDPTEEDGPLHRAADVDGGLASMDT